jgi:hypothetical protein
MKPGQERKNNAHQKEQAYKDKKNKDFMLALQLCLILVAALQRPAYFCSKKKADLSITNKAFLMGKQKHKQVRIR